MIYLRIIFTFFKIGLFTFGGGYAMIPLIQSEVSSHGWILYEDLINFIAISECTPGPFAINISTYIGRITAGPLGAVAATFSVCLPSFIIIILVAKFYEKFKTNKIISSAMNGLRPAAIGLIGAAIVSIARSTLLSMEWDFPLLIAIIMLAGLTFLQLKKVHPILIILISAALGIIVGVTIGLPV